MANITDYRASGVDMEAGDQLVDWIKKQPPSGPSSQVVSGVGGFSALFKLDLKKYKNPLLISCTDGVGTKVKLAVELDRIEPTGQDLVAMCLNDLITCGGDPLFFLDYYASGKLDLIQAQRFLKGVMAALKECDCTLIGGETAEMPGVYKALDYDCAGFAVGVVEEGQVIDGSQVKIGDCAVGIASSGFHSNGYSLIRKVFEKDAKEHADLLMAPTRLYVSFVKSIREVITIKAMAHITGGGILGNIPRVMPQNTALKIQKWPWPDSFAEVQKRTGMTPPQMLETFNCGVGYVIFVDPKDVLAINTEAKKRGWAAWNIGSVVKHSGEPEVLL